MGELTIGTSEGASHVRANKIALNQGATRRCRCRTLHHDAHSVRTARDQIAHAGARPSERAAGAADSRPLDVLHEYPLLAAGHRSGAGRIHPDVAVAHGDPGGDHRRPTEISQHDFAGGVAGDDVVIRRVRSADLVS